MTDALDTTIPPDGNVNDLTVGSRALRGASPDEVVRTWRKAEPKPVRPHPHSPPDPASGPGRYASSMPPRTSHNQTADVAIGACGSD